MAVGISVWSTNLIQKAWVDDVVLEMEKLSNVSRFVGTGPNNIIERKTKLNADKGDTLYFSLARKFSGEPVINEAELVGNEQKLEFVDAEVGMAEMAFASKKAGRFEDIKSKKALLPLMKAELAVQMREKYDEYIIRMLCGDATLTTHAVWTGVAPTAARKLYGGNWDGASAIDTGDDWIRVRDITRAKTHGRHIAGMRPVSVDGVETYVMFMHPYQWGMIRAMDPDYKNAVLYARERSNQNPLWTGIAGWWDGVAIYENDHIIANATYSTAYRAVLCGAQALIMAWGEGPYAGEQDYDFGRKFGVSLSMLWGLKKPTFGPDTMQLPTTWVNDYGVVAVDGYAAAISGTASDTEY